VRLRYTWVQGDFGSIVGQFWLGARLPWGGRRWGRCGVVVVADGGARRWLGGLELRA